MPKLDESTRYRSQDVAFTRLPVSSDEGGMETTVPALVGSLNLRIRDMTSSVQRGPNGATVIFAVRMYGGLDGIVVRQKDEATVSGKQLEVTAVRRHRFHQEIDAERRTT